MTDRQTLIGSVLGLTLMALVIGFFNHLAEPKPNAVRAPPAPICTADQFAMTSERAQYIHNSTAEITGRVRSNCPGEAIVTVTWTVQQADGSFMRIAASPETMRLDPNQSASFYAFGDIGPGQPKYRLDVTPLE